MHNFSIKKSLSVAGTEFIKWVFNPRMIILLVLLVFIKTSAIDPFLTRIADMHEPVNVLEPVIALGNSALIVLVVPLVFLTLISDFPRTDGNTVFVISRTGKVNWLVGQIFFFFMAILSFFIVIFLGSVVPVIFKASFNNQWSYVVTKYYISFPQNANDAASYLIKGNLYNHMKPIEAAFQTYMLMMLHLFSMALIMLLFNIIKKKVLGFVTVGTLIVFGFALTDLKSQYMWLTPLPHSIVWEHYTEILREPVKPMAYSYLYFLVIIVAMIIVAFICLKPFTLDNIQEVD